MLLRPRAALPAQGLALPGSGGAELSLCLAWVLLGAALSPTSLGQLILAARRGPVTTLGLERILPCCLLLLFCICYI